MPRLKPEDQHRITEAKVQTAERRAREEAEFQAYLLTLSPEEQKREKQRRARKKAKERREYIAYLTNTPLPTPIRYSKRGRPR